MFRRLSISVLVVKEVIATRHNFQAEPNKIFLERFGVESSNGPVAGNDHTLPDADLSAKQRAEAFDIFRVKHNTDALVKTAKKLFADHDMAKVAPDNDNNIATQQKLGRELRQIITEMGTLETVSSNSFPQAELLDVLSAGAEQFFFSYCGISPVTKGNWQFMDNLLFLKALVVSLEDVLNIPGTRRFPRDIPGEDVFCDPDNTEASFFEPLRLTPFRKPEFDRFITSFLRNRGKALERIVEEKPDISVEDCSIKMGLPVMRYQQWIPGTANFKTSFAPISNAGPHDFTTIEIFNATRNIFEPRAIEPRSSKQSGLYEYAATACVTRKKYLTTATQLPLGDRLSQGSHFDCTDVPEMKGLPMPKQFIDTVNSKEEAHFMALSVLRE